jgi:hypothetical protein
MKWFLTGLDKRARRVGVLYAHPVKRLLFEHTIIKNGLCPSLSLLTAQLKSGSRLRRNINIAYELTSISSKLVSLRVSSSSERRGIVSFLWRSFMLDILNTARNFTANDLKSTEFDDRVAPHASWKKCQIDS